MNSRVEFSQEQLDTFSWVAKCKLNAPRTLVLQARAGTGKTFTEVNSVNYLTDDRQSVAMMAFGNLNSKDMTAKVAQFCPGRNVVVKTFHSAGNHFILQNWKHLLRRNPRDRVSTWRAYNLTTEVLGGRDVANDVPRRIRWMITNTHSKGRELNPWAKKQDLIDIALRFDYVPSVDDEMDGWNLDRIAQLAHSCMALATKGPTAGQIDFVDMIYLPLKLDWIRPQFNILFIDEGQDLSPSQLEMAKRLYIDTLVWIGDDRQAIYGFRGADTEFAERMINELAADQLTLTQSFRCPHAIVELAAQIVPDFRAHPDNPQGEVIPFDDMDFEQLVDEVEIGDVVLSRYNAPMVSGVLKCLRHGIPACIRGREEEISGLKKIVDECAVGSASVSIPKFLEKLDAYVTAQHERIIASKPRDPQPALDRVSDKCETIRVIAMAASDVDDLKRKLVKIFDQISADQCVTWSSIHRFKGLEAFRVFVLCSTLRLDSVEERNLCYVAFTRCRDELYLVNGAPGDFEITQYHDDNVTDVWEELDMGRA